MNSQQNQAILCIDDEKIILDSLKSQLKEEFAPDFEIEVAESAQEGYEVIDELVEDGISLLLIVSDWLMPNVKGDEFLAKVHDKHPGIVKILLTGQADHEAIKRAYQTANLYDVVHKPWDKSQLVETIRKGLENLN